VAEQRYSNVAVGLLIMAALAILGAAVFSIGGARRFIGSTEIFEAHFHRTNGLQTGAPVTLAGVDIGAVQSIRFPADPHATYVVVRFWVHGAAADRMRADAECWIRTMGLLGDKFIEIGPGTPGAPPVSPGSVLTAHDPVDYETIMGPKNAGDLFANVMSVSSSLRDLLDDMQKGKGLLGQLMRGDKFSLASMQQTFEHLDRASIQLELMLSRINRGQGLAGAMLSEKVNGRKVVQDFAASAASLKVSAERIETLTARLEKAQGLAPRLIEDRQYADEVMRELRDSSRNLEEILRKINTGQGTAGLLVNDPGLYNDAKNLLGGGGWGLPIMRGLYSLTHPFSGAGTNANAPAESLPPVTAGNSAMPAAAIDPSPVPPTPSVAGPDMSGAK
jgi:phospholipid/cholesterol/gamma-HCH transport system substrate-binding protein